VTLSFDDLIVKTNCVKIEIRGTLSRPSQSTQHFFSRRQKNENFFFFPQ
jgi:hypothetical protein